MIRLNHIHIKVQDARAAAQWFVDNFGSKLVDEFNAGEDFIVRTTLAETAINFTQHPNAGNLPPGYAGVHLGLEHIGLEVDSLDATLAKLEKNGVEIIAPPREVRHAGVRRFAFVKGPDATRIEILEKVQ